MSDKKEIIGSLVQFLCEKTQQLPFGPQSEFKIMTLNILSSMEKQALLVHHKILLRVLNYSKVKLTYDEHRLVMELLCSIAFATEISSKLSYMEKQKLEEERSSLQEHLEMTTTKLMGSPDVKIKCLGIIGAIKIVSASVVNIVLDSDEAVKTENISIDDIPPGQIREAAKRVMFIFDSVRDDPYGLAMIYDEMTLEFKAKRGQFNINELFITWLSEMIFKRFNEITVEINAATPSNFSHQLKISCDELPEPEIAVRLGMMENKNIAFLPSLFKLFRLTIQHLYGGLSSMYVFSCMPITLPNNFSDNEDVDREKLNLHFHCANWLREIIGTYCHWTSDDKDALCSIVKQRLKQLVEVENRLGKMLRYAPEGYYPPAASFLDVTEKRKLFETMRKAKKPPTKKARKNANVEGVDEDDDGHVVPIGKFCREIDTQVILLLMEKYKFSTEVSEDELGLLELHFLLDDVFQKISASCRTGSAGSGFYDPIRTIRDLNGSIMESLVGIFQQIRETFVAMSQQANAEDVDDVFYTKDANILKNCFSLILRLFTVIFTCPKLKLDKHKDVRLETLKAVIPADDLPANVDLDVDQFCIIIIEHGTSFDGNVKSIDCAVSLIKYLHTISKVSGCDDHRDTVMKSVENFLKKQWKDAKGNDEEGAAFSSNLEKLLEIYVDGSNLSALEKFIDTMAEDFKFIIGKQISHQQTFPCFTKTNSIVMMRVYMARLSQIILNSHSTNYDFWRRCTFIYSKFKEITKFFGSATAYIFYLKHFLVFMKGFNTQGIVALKKELKDKEKVIKLVRSVQDVTRFSHGLSCDLKVRKSKNDKKV